MKCIPCQKMKNIARVVQFFEFKNDIYRTRLYLDLVTCFFVKHYTQFYVSYQNKCCAVEITIINLKYKRKNAWEFETHFLDIYTCS